MTIPDIDAVRSDRYDDDLRKVLKKGLDHKARVRHLFKVVEVPAEQFTDRRLAVTSDVAVDDLGRFVSGEEERRTDFERFMSRAPTRADMLNDGKRFVENALHAEDCELIRALADDGPLPVVVGDEEWERLFVPAGEGGGERKLSGRVLLYVRTEALSNDLTTFLRDHAVSVHYASDEIKRWAEREYPRTIGFMAGTNPADVKMEIERDRDWQLVRRGTDDKVKLGMVATWRLAIRDEAVLHIMRPDPNAPQEPVTPLPRPTNPEPPNVDDRGWMDRVRDAIPW